MHIADPSLGILGANGIVGAGIPIATGAGMSAKLLKTGRVTACFFGDGGSNQGTFHESINIASAFDLPVVYVCENNLYGVGTRQSQVRKVVDIADRSAAYAIPGQVVDGNDVLAVYQASAEAVARARAGEGPTLIECKTYRWHTHFEGEPDTYRPPEEVETWLAREPIAAYRQHLIANGILDEQDAAQIEADVVRELDAAVEFARTSPLPKPESALQDLWA
jgi:pyruvate dehydrogenase E1 component alpha subunit